MYWADYYTIVFIEFYEYKSQLFGMCECEVDCIL